MYARPLSYVSSHFFLNPQNIERVQGALDTAPADMDLNQADACSEQWGRAARFQFCICVFSIFPETHKLAACGGAHLCFSIFPDLQASAHGTAA